MPSLFIFSGVYGSLVYSVGMGVGVGIFQWKVRIDMV